MRYGNGTSLAMGVAAILFTATPTLARDAVMTVAVEEAAATLAPNQFVWNDVASDEPVNIVINIGEQRAYVYRGGQMVAAATVSTGKDGKETPSGTFTILQKKVDHRSNLYDSAPMPFMQRLTWDGVAIHAGRNPGFPASHGCIRVPTAFAKKLYEVTTLGTEVTVIGADGEIGPAYVPEGDTVEETASANRAAPVLAAR
jgi:lipoprotein-anchoring transpeptidase ErfK/SrfK